MTSPFGTNHAMKRRGGVRLAALARRDHRAEGKNGSENVTAAPPRNNLRDGPIFMCSSPMAGMANESTFTDSLRDSSGTPGWRPPRAPAAARCRWLREAPRDQQRTKDRL